MTFGNFISQLGIVIFGGWAIWLLSLPRPAWRRWGYIFGAASVPFFVYAAIEARQWGMLGLTGWYAISWAYGIYTFWIEPLKGGDKRGRAHKPS